MAQRNRRAHEIELRSARLELDLLKKHIHPHFLLNSLNSIIAWLEEEPNVAVKLVDALAGELRMLLSFSGRKLISLREELALCEAHLKVMSLRQEKDFTLDTNIRADSGIPPLVLHTLVENGLTHGYRGREKGYFSIVAEKTGEVVRIVVFNDGRVESGESGDSGGTGTRYIQSRLEEAFPSRWKFRGGPADGGWHVEITYAEG
jgi:LytS/YehU family sensor histidine kinase